MFSDASETDPIDTPANPPDSEQQADRPPQRMLIGSERDKGASLSAAEAKPQPVTPAAPPAATAKQPPPKKKEPKHYPPPNIRDRLSPEMEAEYAAALGDLSLESLMSQSETGQLGEEIAAETRVKGRVAKIYGEDVFIDLDGRNQGVIPMRQFDSPPAVGEELELLIVRFNSDEGFYELSRLTAAVDVGNWSEVNEGQIIEVTVTGANKGGLECQVAGIRVHSDGAGLDLPRRKPRGAGRPTAGVRRHRGEPRPPQSGP